MPALLMALSGCVSSPEVVIDSEAPGTEKSRIETPRDVPERATQARQTRTDLRISIAAVGDMMLGTDYPRNHLPDDDGAGFLAAVAPILRSADLAAGNLEGVLMDGGEPRKVCSDASACFLFRSPARYARHFVNAGFDVLSLANNHARDFGEDGRSASMRILDAEGIAHSGREGDFASLEVNDLKVAVLAFAVTQKSNLLHDYDLAAQIVLQHASSHDIVIVSFHGGAEGNDVTRLPFGEEEYHGEPRGDVVRFARSMVDAGADLVFGHGPHVVRAMEHYQNRLIAYSLGNFATYYGISVDGLNGIAPILLVTLDGEGRFVDGRLHSTVQIRPGGPIPDDSDAALNLIRDLSHQDFGTPGIAFEDDGTIRPETRTAVRPRETLHKLRRPRRFPVRQGKARGAWWTECP
jgi:poly-gamma-glutamate capsule biosynthesis protein CapA/YwtB (metallophosphatase superfamily)